MEYKLQNVVCQNCKKDFTIEPDDFGFYEKIKVPPPTFCPECRRQRRWAWRNNMSLYSRKCASCDKSVVSLYAPSSDITIYCNKCWWSDKWDAKTYGVDYDFSVNFFSQLRKIIGDLEVEELDQARLERMFAFYNANWRDYYGTDKVFVVE